MPSDQFFNNIMAWTSYISMRSWWYPLATKPTRLLGFLIVLAHWNNSLLVDMLLHSDTLSWYEPTSIC